MEAHKNYFDLHELASSITRIANNLANLTEIMTTTSINIDPVKAKAGLNEWCGNIVMDEVSKKFWAENEKGKLKDDLQDIKLENDRLKQRDAIMLRFITSLCCSGETCSRDCDLYYEWNDHDCCALLHPKELDHVASDILKKLEDL